MLVAGLFLPLALLEPRAAQEVPDPRVEPALPWFEQTLPSPVVVLPAEPLAELACVPLDLERCGTAHVLRDGRVLVQEPENGDVHVFGPDGERLLVCRSPNPERAYGRLGILQLDSRGRILSSRGMRMRSWLNVYDGAGRWQGIRWFGQGDERNLLAGFLHLLPQVDGYWGLGSGLEIELVVQGRVQRVLVGRPDGETWGECRMRVAPDGGLGVVDGTPTASPSCGMVFASADDPPRLRPNRQRHLFLYDARGRFGRWLPLPAVVRFSGFELGAGWVVFGGGAGQLLLLDLRADRLHRARLPEDIGREQRWGFPTDHAPDELWCVDREPRCLRRFELPPR